MALNDPDIPLDFIPKFREFGLRVLDGGDSFIGIDFCPWCGQKLPTSLRDEWFDQLEQRGIDPESEEMPSEFKNEGWYTNMQ
jgi:hypothetical protein